MLRQVLLIRLQSPWQHLAATAFTELYIGVQQIVERLQFFVRIVNEIVEYFVRYLAKYIQCRYLQ